MWNWINKNALLIAWVIALIATAGSLYASNILHWTPCILCWWQRILIFPLVIILAAGILKEIKDVEYVVLPMTIIGIGVAFYHNLLQWGVITEKIAPCTAIAPCVTNYHIGLPFITMPFLSLLTFIAITGCMFIHNHHSKIRA